METKINKIRVKPRFKIISEVDKDAITQKLKNYILENETIYDGNINNEVASIYAKTSHNNFWKPYLSLRIETVEHKNRNKRDFWPQFCRLDFFYVSLLWFKRKFYGVHYFIFRYQTD